MSESAEEILRRLKPSRRRPGAAGQAAPTPDDKPPTKGAAKTPPKADA